MAPRLARLLRRRSAPPATPAALEPGDVHDEAIDAAEWEPAPVLRPAAIFRQVLINPAETVPAWLRPRPAAPAPADAAAPPQTKNEIAAGTAPTDDPKPAKRTRQRKASGSSAPTRTRTRRTAKAEDPSSGAM